MLKLSTQSSLLYMESIQLCLCGVLLYLLLVQSSMVCYSDRGTKAVAESIFPKREGFLCHARYLVLKKKRIMSDVLHAVLCIPFGFFLSLWEKKQMANDFCTTVDVE